MNDTNSNMFGDDPFKDKSPDDTQDESTSDGFSARESAARLPHGEFSGDGTMEPLPPIGMSQGLFGASEDTTLIEQIAPVINLAQSVLYSSYQVITGQSVDPDIPTGLVFFEPLERRDLFEGVC